MNTVLKLVFLRSDDKTKTLTIPNVKPAATSNEIKEVVDAILQGDIFGDDQYSLVSLKEASIVTTNGVSL